MMFHERNIHNVTGSLYKVIDGVLHESVMQWQNAPEWEPVADVAALLRGLELAFDQMRKERDRAVAKLDAVIRSREEAKQEGLRLAKINEMQLKAFQRR